MTGREGKRERVEEVAEWRVGEYSLYVGGHGAACLPQLFLLRCFYCLLLLLLEKKKNANITRDFIQVMQQRSARSFLVVSRVGRCNMLMLNVR